MAAVRRAGAARRPGELRRPPGVARDRAAVAVARRAPLETDLDWLSTSRGQGELIEGSHAKRTFRSATGIACVLSRIRLDKYRHVGLCAATVVAVRFAAA
ncbi:hypothetical protein FAGKG844_240035 [Frankia sp. AgKG'84/4]